MLLNHMGQPVQYWACCVTRHGIVSLLLVLGSEEEMQHYVASEWYHFNDAEKESFSCHAISSDLWDELTKHVTAYVAPSFEGGIPF